MIPIVPDTAPEPARPPATRPLPSGGWADDPGRAWLWSVAFHGQIVVGLAAAVIALRLILTLPKFDDALAVSPMLVGGLALALAGHRSLQYLSTKRLNADLAAQLRHPGTRS